MTTPSEEIDNMIQGLTDWRGPSLAHLRDIINMTVPNLKEDWKWGTPVWTNKGNLIGLAAFKEHVKINFFKGAHLADPSGLFNSGLDAKESRSIDLREGEPVDEPALQSLITSAANYNG